MENNVPTLNILQRDKVRKFLTILGRFAQKI